MVDKTYCVKSNNCKNTECPRHLKGFNGLYVSLAEFDCRKDVVASKLEKLINEEDD